MKDYTVESPQFSDGITIPETTDTNHADNINAAPKQLLQNTLVNRNGLKAMGIPDDYNEEITYAAGDYCNYQNRIYMCTTETTGDFDESCWEEISVTLLAERIQTLENSVTNNCTTTEEGFILDARQGKVLQDQIDENASGVSENASAITQLNNNLPGNFNNFLVAERHSFSVTLEEESDHMSEIASVTVTKSGYYPLGIVGWFISGWQPYLNTLRLSNLAVGSCDIAFRITNPYGTSTEFHGEVTILWRKVMS